jgi:hypothetical protein
LHSDELLRIQLYDSCHSFVIPTVTFDKASKMYDYFKSHKLEFGTAHSKVSTKMLAHMHPRNNGCPSLLNSDVSPIHFRLNCVTRMLMQVLRERFYDDKSAFELFSIFIAIFNKIIYRKCFVQLTTFTFAVFTDAE